MPILRRKNWRKVLIMLKTFGKMPILFQISAALGLIATIATIILAIAMTRPIQNSPKPLPTQTKIYLKGMMFRVYATVDFPIPDQKLQLRVSDTEYENGNLVGVIGTLILDPPEGCNYFDATTDRMNQASVVWLCPIKFSQSQSFDNMTVTIPGVGIITAYADGFDIK